MPKKAEAKSIFVETKKMKKKAAKKSIFVETRKLDTEEFEKMKDKKTKLAMSKELLREVTNNYEIAKRTLRDLTKEYDEEKKEDPPEPSKKQPIRKTVFQKCEEIFYLMERYINEDMIKHWIQIVPYSQEEIRDVMATWDGITDKKKELHKLFWCLFPATIRKELSALEDRLQKLKTLMERSFTPLLIEHFFYEDFGKFLYEKMLRMIQRHQAIIRADSTSGRRELMAVLLDYPEHDAGRYEVEEGSVEGGDKEKMLKDAIVEVRGLIIDYENVQQHWTLEYLFKRGELLVNQLKASNEGLFEGHVKNLNLEESAILRSNWEGAQKSTQTNHKLLWCFEPYFKKELDAAIDRLHKLVKVMEKTFIAQLIKHYYIDDAGVFNYKKIRQMLQQRHDEMERGVTTIIAIKDYEPMDET
jgi:hypothetical protein